jgi:polysaccharide export outer membrane protein
MFTHRVRLIVCGIVVLCCAIGSLAAQAPSPPPAYIIGPQDVLSITVFDQAELSGKYTVESDGALTFPLVGRVKASGFTVRQLEVEVRKKLVDGQFLRNPQLSIGIEQYRSQRIFIMGEVRQSGMYPLTGDMSLVEALSKAGVMSTNEVVIVRAKGATGPILPGQDKSAEVIKVDVRALQAGTLSQNVSLHDGDTIFVPRPESAYVFGQVRNPGAYPVGRDTTVLQALSLAGGITEHAATGRIRIMRFVGGKIKEVKVTLTDIVQPGDTIVVPERWF